MPKVFLTGSGVTRGYVTGSGIITNPARVRLRARDNFAGANPTIHRMNRTDNTGIVNNIKFDDTKVVKFGDRIFDDFEFKISQPGITTKAVDANKWLVSNTDILMKKEIVGNPDIEDPDSVSKGVLLLAGTGSDGRWIQTVKKVAHPTVRFGLLQGPYNSNADLTTQIRLHQGLPTDVLAVQVSTTAAAGSWKTIPILKEYISLTASPLLLNSEGKFLPAPPNLVLSDVDANGNIVQIVQNVEIKRPVLKVCLDLHVFSTASYNEPFYIRWVQESVSDEHRVNWALTDVDITSRNDQVTYPILNVNDSASLYQLSQSVVTPNFIGSKSLTTTGSSREDVTDLIRLNFENESITPFNEQRTIVTNNDSFFAKGVTENVIPGFGKPLKSKTFFDVNFKTTQADTELKLGNLKASPSSATRLSSGNDDGQMLMAYWNFDLDRWQTIGQPIRDNRGSAASDLLAVAKTRDILTGSCLGFGPMMAVATGSVSNDDFRFYDHEYLASFFKPISTFGFPIDARYHATASQYVPAKDIGITKPMLLEKFSWTFDADFEIPSDDTSINPQGSFAYNVYTSDGSVNTFNPERRLKMYTPTFFILVQRDEFRNADQTGIRPGTPGYNNKMDEITLELPKVAKLTSGSNEETQVFQTRDLVSFGQYQLIVTASTATASVGSVPALAAPPRENFRDSGLTLQNFLQSGIIRDGFDIKEITNSSLKNTIEVRGRQLNFPARLASRHNDMMKLRMFDLGRANVGDFIYVNLDNKYFTRDVTMDGTGRSIVNGFSSLEKAGKSVNIAQHAGGGSNRVFTIELDKSLDKISPYVIFPDDKIIFGVQYPVQWDTTQGCGGIGTTKDLDFNFMTLRDSKLRIFGSQIKDNKEHHEGLNQNLTTVSAYEAVGNDSVVDKFDVVTRGGLTGSMADDFLFTFQHIDDIYQPNYSFGKLAPPHESLNVTSSWQLELRKTSNSDPNILGPVKRLEGAAVSGFGTSLSLINYARLNPAFGSAVDSRKYVQQPQRFSSFYDPLRTFIDARFSGSDETSYGSMRNHEPVSPFFANVPGVIRLGGTPKYYYSRNHFGQLADSVRGGLDGNFVSRLLHKSYSDNFVNDSGVNLFADSAIKTQFVNEITVQEDATPSGNPISGINVYVLVSPNEIDNTSYDSFQSSNLSLFATSSIPFFDDNVVRNRNYSPDTAEIS